MYARILIVTSLFVALLFAGCVDEAAPTNDDAAPSASPGTATGTIEGQVATVSLDYIADATVYAIKGGSIQQATTDDRGRFVIADLEPGDYRLQAAKIGYENAVAAANVTAGQTSTVSFLLEPLVIKDPYDETLEFRGFFECAFGTVFITDTCTFGWRTTYDAMKEETGQEPPIPRDPSNNQNTFPWTIGADAQAVMSEMVWDDGGGTTEKMMMLLSSTPIDNACDCSEHDHIQKTGTSPLRALVGREPPDVYPDDVTVTKGGELWNALANSDNGTVEVASRGFLPFDTSAGYSHAFTLYVTTFYNSYPEADFTAVPESGA